MKKKSAQKTKNQIKRAVGRPRAFNSPEEMIKLINEYFEINEGATTTKILRDGTAVLIPDPQPIHIAGLCAYLNIDSETLRQYQKLEGFSAPIENAKQICEAYAVTMCFRGKNKADFVLQNNFGWRNKSEVENKGETKTKIVYVDKEEKESYEQHIDDVINS